MENKNMNFDNTVINIVSQYAVSDIYKSYLSAAFLCQYSDDYSLLYLVYPDWNYSLETVSRNGRFFHSLYEETGKFLKAYPIKEEFIKNNIHLMDSTSIKICYDKNGLLVFPREKEKEKVLVKRM